MTRKFLAFATLFVSLAIPLHAQTIIGSSPRVDITLNGTWQYVLNQPQVIPTSGWLPTRVPALPLDDGTASVWYEQSLTVPSAWIQPGRRFFIKLGQAGHYAAVYVNGVFQYDHFGQYSPFEVEVTPSIVVGSNEIEIYVHKADTIYIRRGININQSGCPADNPDCIGNAYRPSAGTDQERNWVGLTGDITFEWRPSTYLSDVYVIPSVRNGTLQANVTVNGQATGLTAKAQVLDGTKSVLILPTEAVVSGTASLLEPWTNPTLWAPGNPKLYVLQTKLLQGTQVLDTTYTRFGFREVWVSGKQVLLNGSPLWMTGDYANKLSPIRTVNDRRPQALGLFILESSGFNTLQSHWDDPGASQLDLADEMGLLVVGSFFCNGVGGQSQVDTVTDWTNWMSSTTSEWVMAERNHPSIVLWRPADVLPPTVPQSTLYPALASAIRALDTTRPIADGSDVDTWGQNVQSSSGVCDNGAAFAAQLASETKPLLIKEIYGDYALPCSQTFFNTLYQEAFTGGGVGMIIQNLSIFGDAPFTPSWFSISGLGNRPAAGTSLPNWFSRKWSKTAFSTQFAGLYQTYVGTLLHTSPVSGDYHATGLPSDTQTAFLSPVNGLGSPVGVVTAQDGTGTAWLVVPGTGFYDLIYSTGGTDVITPVTVSAPPPF